MNPRQRRGALLMALAAIGAIAVFLSVSNYVADVRSQVGPMVSTVRLTSSVPPYTPVTPDMVELVDLPARWSPATAVRDPLEVTGMVPTSPLPAGTVLQAGMLVPPPEVAEGEREIAIMVDAETGVAGKIGSGSIVDIYATFPAEAAAPAQAVSVVERARIVDVGTPTVEGQQDASGAFTEGEVVPVTFALSPGESLQLAYIESFATKVRLVLRAPTDDEVIEEARRRYQPTIVSPATADAASPSPGG